MKKINNVGQDFIVKREDGHSLKGTEFIPKNIIATLLIVHGMTEHRKRYFAFANYLYENNIAVFLYDQRGHGESILPEEMPGFLAADNGWNFLIEDLGRVVSVVKTKVKESPFFIMGHSMGSFVLRSYLAYFSNQIDGAIICGTSGMSAIVPTFGEKIAKKIIKKKGATYVSPFLEKMAFGNYNKKIKPHLTKFDWLTCDEYIVKQYIKDNLCGFPCPTIFYKDLFYGLAFVNKKSTYKRYAKTVPLFIISGDMDPVGNYGKGVKRFYKKLKRQKIKDIEFKLYENGRHEIHNELFADEVYSDILNWINGKLITTHSN